MKSIERVQPTVVAMVLHAYPYMKPGAGLVGILCVRCGRPWTEPDVPHDWIAETAYASAIDLWPRYAACGTPEALLLEVHET